MKKIIFISAFLALLGFATSFAQDLQLTYKYSYYDVYRIQQYYTYNNSCITSTTLSERGESGIGYEYKDFPYRDSFGNLHTRKVRVEVEKPGNYYTYTAPKNICSDNEMLKGIRKIRTSTGQILYEDASYLLKAGETLQGGDKFVDSYDAQSAEIGSTVYYKNELDIDPDTYNTYKNLVANNSRGTLVVSSTTSRTRIYLNKGDKVRISAGGSVRLGMFAGSGGPNGIDGFTSYSTTNNAKHGALIYRIGGDSNWYFVGSSATITAHESGLLRLTVNDNNINDNEGQFIVNYEIIRANRTSNTTSGGTLWKSKLLPQSCVDLKEIANFSTSELATYIINNGFTSGKSGEYIEDLVEQGFQCYKREKDDESVFLAIKKDNSNYNNTLVLGTDSEERYLKVKKSLSAEGYAYITTEKDFEVYRKTTSLSYSSSTDVLFSDLGYIYIVIIITPNN